MERLDTRRSTPKEPEEESEEDFGSFGYLRGIKERSIMLEFRFLNGNTEAMPYHSLERLVYNPSEGLLLQFHDGKIRLKGQKFNTVQSNGIVFLQALLRNRITWVQESDELKAKILDPNRVIFSKIEIG